MKIAIVGAGAIGNYIAGVLSHEKHDVTILDKDEEKLNELSSSYDLLAIKGNAASANSLIKMDISKADLFIAVTDVDEVNMISCMMSKRLGAKKTIARIRSSEYSDKSSPVKPEDFGIDVVIQPEFSTASEIVLLLKRASASDVLDMAGGKMQLVGIKLDKHAGINGKTLRELSEEIFPVDFRVVAIKRGLRTIIPSGNDSLLKNDQIFVIAKQEVIADLLSFFGLKKRTIEKVMIAGGGTIAEHLIQLLSEQLRNVKIKIIDSDEKRCYKFASDYKQVMVLCGNPTDPDLLVSEGVSDTDVFVSVTDDEESNIISCLMAKHLGVFKVIAHVSKGSYIPLSQTIGLDLAVNSKQAASNDIHSHIMHQGIHSVNSMHGIEAELLEIELTEKFKNTGRKVSNITFPEGCIVGAIQRNDELFIATGERVLEVSDRLFIFAVHSSLTKVLQFFK